MKIIPGSGRHYYLSRISIFLIAAALISGMLGCAQSPPPTPIPIDDWYDLDGVRDNLSDSYILMNDLDSSTPGYDELASPMANGGRGWKPIGTSYNPYTAILDGQGYEIRDMFINRPDEWYVGLFSTVGGRGVIQNIGVVNADVTGGEYVVGGLVGDNEGAVSNSYSTGNVNGDKWVGGLVGANEGNVSDCYFTGSVTGNFNVGGLVGRNFYGGTVSNSHYDYDEVLINGENIITIGALFHQDFEEWLANDKFLDIGERLSEEDGYYVVNNITDFKELLAFGQNSSLKFGLTNDLDLREEPNFYIPYLAGEFDGNDHRILNLSFNFDFVSHVGLFGYLAPGGSISQVGVENVNITGGRDIGGLVGYNHGTVSNSYSTGHVHGDDNIGGLVGYNNDTISNSYSTSNVTGNSGVGGLVGWNWEGTVSNSYSTGSITGNSLVGGLVGKNGFYNPSTVSDSYSMGSVTGTSYVGGLVGYIFKGTVSNCYSTSNVTGNSYVGGLVGYLEEDFEPYSFFPGSATGDIESEGVVKLSEGSIVSNSFWDTETSEQATSAGGTGKTTAQMKDIDTFSGAGWNIIAVALNQTNPAYIWNIVNNMTYPFLSWQP
jgi:hypothetical protein